MKKTLSIVLCLITLFTVCACTAQQNKPATGYDELLVKLEQTVDSLFSKNFDTELAEGKYTSPTGELDDQWFSMLKDAKADFANVDENAFGYKVVDLNSDGTSELLFCRSDNRVLALYTVHDGKATLVDAFTRSYYCVIRDSGEVYTMTVRDNGGYDYKISTLNGSTGTLVTTVNFGIEGTISYEAIQGSIYTTSTERISELCEEYPFEASEAYKAIDFNLF